MNRSTRVRQVYEVLRDSNVDDLSPRELLRCAALMVEASDEPLHGPATSLNVGPPPISELPLHVIFEQMSWKLINRELEW